jgi:pimeloyl-ACP methyl ester carboxylesterase
MKIAFPIFFFLFVLVSSTCAQQKPIHFGSNNGKYVSINKIRIYYEEYGKGTPLLLLHGGLGNISDFKKCIPDLSKKYRVIAADSPSHGRSGMADSLSYDLMAQHFSKFIDQLKLDSVYVMGWSDGGVIALLLAADRSDKVKKIIATGANIRADEVLAETLAFTNNMSVKAVEDNVSTNPWLKNWLETYQKLSGSADSWKKYIVDIKALWLTPIYISKEKMQSISVPALLAYGDHDLIKLDHALENYRLLKKSQFCIVPNTTHSIYDEKPDFINQVAFDFFK